MLNIYKIKIFPDFFYTKKMKRTENYLQIKSKEKLQFLTK